MNAESGSNSRTSTAGNAVIKPWLIAGLVIAVAGYVLFTAVLIMLLSHFDDSKRQADEADARTATQCTKIAKLRDEVGTLTDKKDMLVPMIADWQQRLKEKIAAEAVLATLDQKQRQADSDIVQATKRLDELDQSVLVAERQKTELASAIDQLKSELATLTKTNTDAKSLVRLASEAERRFVEATNAFASVETRRKQSEADASAARTRYEQIQKESDDLRQSREKLTIDLVELRQQVQAQKDLLATFDQKMAELNALQIATQKEEEKKSKLQQQCATAEARVTEMEYRLSKAVLELGQVTNRMEQARNDCATVDARLNSAKTALQTADAEVAGAQKRLAEIKASQEHLASEQAKLAAQFAASKKDLEQARKDGAEAEIRRDSAKGDLQKTDADIVAGRAQLQVFVVKQDDLTRETSRLEFAVESLKKEKAALQKEIGNLEAQRQKNLPDGQK